MYYQGDYTRARFRGDPGFLSFLKGIGSAAASFIPGIGGIASKAIMNIPTPVKKIAARVVKSAAEHPALTAAGAAATTAAAAGGIALHTKGTSMTPAAAGGMSMGGRRGLGGTGRHRRMHVTNVKALHRSLRRIKGFEKVARSVLHFTQPGKTHGRARFKFHRKRR